MTLCGTCFSLFVNKACSTVTQLLRHAALWGSQFWLQPPFRRLFPVACLSNYFVDTPLPPGAKDLIFPANCALDILHSLPVHFRIRINKIVQRFPLPAAAPASDPARE
jgi:hypothetical protein